MRVSQKGRHHQFARRVSRSRNIATVQPELEVFCTSYSCRLGYL